MPAGRLLYSVDDSGTGPWSSVHTSHVDQFTTLHNNRHQGLVTRESCQPPRVEGQDVTSVNHWLDKWSTGLNGGVLLVGYNNVIALSLQESPAIAENPRDACVSAPLFL